MNWLDHTPGEFWSRILILVFAIGVLLMDLLVWRPG